MREREQLVDVVFRNNEPIFIFSNPTNVSKCLLDGNRDHLLAQARSELMKQEHKLESLNKSNHELQQQAHAQRLELHDDHHGYVAELVELAGRIHNKAGGKKVCGGLRSKHAYW